MSDTERPHESPPVIEDLDALLQPVSEDAPTGEDIRATIARAYEAVNRIHFDSAHFRRDIGHRALNRPN